MTACHLRLALIFTASGLLSCPIVAHAQAESGEAQAAPAESDPLEGDRIIVRAGGLERLDMLAGTSVVEGLELQRNSAGQLGEVLTSLPGVSATSFAPGASRPILRGFQGARVRVLTNGLGALDASNSSADHAVAINPLTAERIEVLRGPAVLLFGSSAIGGAVNVIDRRIPFDRPRGGLRLDALAGIDSAYDLREIGAAGDAAIGQNLVFHLDGTWRETSDVEIAGYALAEELRADLLAEAAAEADEHPQEAEELRQAALQRDVLPNSAAETHSLGSGVAWVSHGVSVGLSLGYYDTAYGVPGRPGAGHHHAHDHEGHGEGAHDGPVEEEHGEADVSIDLEQVRAEFAGQVHLSDTGLFHDLVARIGYSDYTHTEFEGDEVGTIFEVEGVEGRVELIQNDRDFGAWEWRGSVGGQYLSRDFAATGPEAFVPPNSTEQAALFALQELESGGFEAEFGGRYEHSALASQVLGLAREFDTFSAALGLSYSLDGGVRIGVNTSRSERAPSAEELFAEGPHIATQQYERGDPNLGVEAAWGAEAYLAAAFAGIDLRVAMFQNWFDDFIYLTATGLVEDELPVFAYAQANADHFGMEGEASFPIAQLGEGQVVGDLRGSYIRATLEDGTPLPRIPPLSLLGALEWQSDRFDARAEIEWFDEQTRIAPFETSTDGFAHMNLSLAWKPRGIEHVTMLLQADNLLDVQGRRHASFTKDFVPLAGRNVALSVRATF